MLGRNAAIKLADLLRGPNGIFLISLGCLFLVGIYYFLRWPISGGNDTDLWYHLNGGRYFFEHHRPAESGFFSYLASNRNWTNYYWFFQVIVYAVYYVFDYQGLIVFRTVAYLITIGGISCFFLLNTKKESASLYFTIVSMLFFLALLHRYFGVVRPHIFSYILIVYFIYILERRNIVGIFALPFLAVFWCNVHGVEYPVLILICFAYLVEILISRIKDRTPIRGTTFIVLVAILLACYAVFATPFGSSLLFSPYQSAKFQYLYIGELRHVQLAKLLQLNFSTVERTFDSLSNLILLIATLSFLTGLISRKIRISHFLLFAGGLFLLIRAYRFRYEAVLLALPIIASHPLIPEACKEIKIPQIVKFMITGFMVFVSLSFLNIVFTPRPRYPFTPTTLPAGISSFLNYINAGGKILNDPNHGGYLQWELDKSYSIYMDLEMMLFNDIDAFTAAYSFVDNEILKKVISRYNPGFIIPVIENKNFSRIISKFPKYKAIFIDDAAILYADSIQYPQITQKYGLQSFNPFNLPDMNYKVISEKEADDIQKDIEKIYNIYPNGELVNRTMALLSLKQKKHDKALHFADQIIANFPAQPRGVLLKGDILVEQKRYKDALPYYEKTIDLLGQNNKAPIYRKISFCYAETGQPGNAYTYFKKSVKIFSPNTPVEDYYTLGQFAIAAGEYEDGAMFLNFALLKASASEKDLTGRIKRSLLELALKKAQ